MAHLKQQFRDALSAIEPGEDTTSGPEAHRLVRDTVRHSARSWSPGSPTPVTSEELSNA